jgi:hypothetical protein
LGREQEVMEFFSFSDWEIARVGLEGIGWLAWEFFN